MTGCQIVFSLYFDRQLALLNFMGSLWMPSFPFRVSIAPLSLVSAGNLLRENSAPPSMLPTQIVNAAGPSTKPTCHWSPFGHWAIDHKCLRVTIQPTFYLGSALPITFTPLQFRDKEVVQTSVKCFVWVQVDDSSCSSLILAQHASGFSLIEAMWAVINHLLIFHVP